MARFSISGIANAISSKHALSKSEAENFVITLFDLINEGLYRDKIVKVKGLGTFKVIDVRERESINVNTRERMTIGGHGKITFIPDSVMRDLVNKPFSQFETVALNDGVDMEELNGVRSPESSDHAGGTDGEADGNNGILAEGDDISETASVQEECIVPVSFEPEENQEQADKTDGTFILRHKWPCLTLMFLIIAGAAFIAGYHFHEYMTEAKVKHMKVYVYKKHLAGRPPSSLYKDTVKNDAGSLSGSEDKAKTDVEIKTDTAKSRTDSKDMSSDSGPVLKNATAMVNTGAYRIVGTDTTITVKKGESLKQISKFYFGDGMECYVQVYNGIAEVKEGQRLKIPELEHKKKRK